MGKPNPHGNTEKIGSEDSKECELLGRSIFDKSLKFRSINILSDNWFYDIRVTLE